MKERMKSEASRDQFEENEMIDLLEILSDSYLENRHRPLSETADARKEQKEMIDRLIAYRRRGELNYGSGSSETDLTASDADMRLKIAHDLLEEYVQIRSSAENPEFVTELAGGMFADSETDRNPEPAGEVCEEVSEELLEEADVFYYAAECLLTFID